MNFEDHESFQRMIDQTLAGVISTQGEQSLREHLSTCASCKEYLSASNRVIESLSGFSFEVNPTLNARVLAALRLQMRQDFAARPHRRRFIRPHSVSLKLWTAFAAALSMSFAGSTLVYQVARYLTIPMHFDNTRVQAGVLVFWLLPSLCAAFCVLAAPIEKRGIA
jgi:hypothetical protein